MPASEGTIRLGLVQQADAGTREKNLERAEGLVREAAEQGAEVVCLQELFATGYVPLVEDPDRFGLAEPVPGATTDRMGELADALDTVIVAPVFEERAPGVYHNTACVLDADGSLAGRYRKMHIPHDPNFHEKYYFTPGDPDEDGFGTVDTAAGRLGVLVCWDQWFPEGARATALDGADVLLYPTCIGHSDADEDVHEAQLDAWRTVQRAHAIANGTYVAAANRVGREGPVTFWGESFVAGPLGQVEARAPFDEEHVLVHELDLDRAEGTRKAWPFLRDRRPEAYEGLLSRYRDG
jgi:N-carbamoylputrescine amidase